LCAALSKSRTLSAPPPKKLEKQRLISGFLKSLTTPDAAIAARFLSGYVFAAHDERTLGIGGTNLFRVIAETAGQPSHNLGTAYRKHGGLGDMAEELLRSTNAKGDLALPEVAQLFEELAAARGQSQKAALLRNAFQSASAGDVKYIVKIITGDLRIGSKESLVEEAIAKAFDRPLEEVRRANMLTGDIGETLTLAAGAGSYSHPLARLRRRGIYSLHPGPPSNSGYEERRLWWRVSSSLSICRDVYYIA